MSRLPVSSAEYHRLANRMVELTAEYLQNIDNLPSFPHCSGQQTEELFGGAPPECGLGEAALDAMADVFAHGRVTGPRFFGYVFGSGEPVAALADLAASVLNQNVTAWRSGPSAVAIERTVVGWLADAVGCHGFTGSLAGGGSSANLMALCMAREHAIPGSSRTGLPRDSGQPVVYASAEAHMSMAKAAAILGLGYDAMRLIPVDQAFQMDIAALDHAIETDLRAGRVPVAIVASAGTTATGSIDDMTAIAEIARRRNIWMHVDGAYGALAAMAMPEKFTGMGQADSVSLDPHKWLYQPADCGCLLYRDSAMAQKVFAHSGDYAKSLISDPIEGFAFFEESMELSRRFRALKLWLSIRYHGMGAFRESIGEDLRLARHLASRISKEPSLELLAPVALSAVCFRFVDAPAGTDLNALNQRILQAVIDRRKVYISNANIRGEFALRACIVNHRTTASDVEAVVTETLAAAQAVLKSAAL